MTCSLTTFVAVFIFKKINNFSLQLSSSSLTQTINLQALFMTSANGHRARKEVVQLHSVQMLHHSVWSISHESFLNAFHANLNGFTCSMNSKPASGTTNYLHISGFSWVFRFYSRKLILMTTWFEFLVLNKISLYPLH